MAKITISYSVYPNCPKATDSSRRHASGGAALGIIVNLACFAGIICIISGIGTLAKQNEWRDFIEGIVIAIVAGGLIWLRYILYHLWSEKRVNHILIHEKFENPVLNSENGFVLSPAVLEEKIENSYKEDLRKSTKSFLKIYPIVVAGLCAAVFLFHLLAGNF